MINKINVQAVKMLCSCAVESIRDSRNESETLPIKIEGLEQVLKETGGLCTVAQTTYLLGRSRQHIYELVNQGLLKVIKRPSGFPGQNMISFNSIKDRRCWQNRPRKGDK